VGIFALSAGLAALAGWAFSFTGYISPGQFTWTMSVNILVMVIFGGINTRIGPLIGAAFVSAFPVVVSINPLVQEAIFGLIFLLVIVLVPGGVMGILGWVWHRFVRRNGAETEPPSTPQTAASPRSAAQRTASAPPPATGDTILDCVGIRFAYIKGNVVVDDVNLHVRRGTIHGLIGPNGSGKSTLVNLISGALQPDAGTISISSARVDGLPAYRRPKFGLLRTFQSAVLADELSIRESVTIGLYHRTPRIAARSMIWPLLPTALRDHRRIRAEASEAIAAVGLAEKWNGVRVADVPHGVAQLTQLAAACVGEPSILILDEPLAGLSPKEVEEVTAIVRDLRAQGVTLVIVEHQTQFIFNVCDDVTVLAAGKLVTSGPADEVRQNERVREVYLGQ
jgi:branched-chain amino acid transport system permease protein